MRTLTKGLITAMILGGATLLSAQGLTNNGEEISTQRYLNKTKQSEITMEQAKEIALDRVGFTEDEARWLGVEYDIKNSEYEIDFRNNGMKYEFEIDAKTGEATCMNVEREFGFYN